jgi:hypothetical protein
MPILKPLFTEDQLLVAQLTGKLPLMLTTRMTAAVLGVKVHDVKAFIRAGVISPLGVPLSEGDGYFDRETVLALATSRAALAKARRGMKAIWAGQNGNNAEGDDE